MENTETQETRKTIYDANASQRFAFEVIENGEKFDSAHRLKPITDERYLGFVEAVDLTGDEAEVTKQANEAAIALWNDLIIEVENFELEENQEIKDAIASGQKIAIITKFLAVAVVEPEKKAGGVRKAVRADRQTITTEMYFDDEPVKQKHVLQATSDEWRKKYDRIKSRRFKQEKTTV